jgi:hypothetical protein
VIVAKRIGRAVLSSVGGDLAVQFAPALFASSI